MSSSLRFAPRSSAFTLRSACACFSLARSSSSSGRSPVVLAFLRRRSCVRSPGRRRLRGSFRTLARRLVLLLLEGPHVGAALRGRAGRPRIVGQVRSRVLDVQQPVEGVLGHRVLELPPVRIRLAAVRSSSGSSPSKSTSCLPPWTARGSCPRDWARRTAGPAERPEIRARASLPPHLLLGSRMIGAHGGHRRRRGEGGEREREGADPRAHAVV